jgi:hypothetical protein
MADDDASDERDLRRGASDARAPNEVARARLARRLDPHPSRSTSIAVGAVVVMAFAFLIARGLRKPHTPPPPPVASEQPASSSESGEQKLAKAMADLQSVPPNETSDGLTKILEALDDVGPSNVGRKMPDGSDPPPLSSTAPRRVRFGVVLVRYRGAQMAPLDAQGRDDALSRAKLLATLAKDDFAAAVKSGDVGSFEDIGTVKRGVLEPATEYVLFTTPVGWVTDVLDTPRGFWIAKRLQ